jgi:hypothetical protein
MTDAAQVVTAHVWRLRRRHVPFGLLRAAERSGRVQRRTNASFARLLGTASGQSFTVADTRLSTWALIATWENIGARREFEQTAYAQSWAARSAESASLTLSALSSRGQWAGRAPFGVTPMGTGAATEDPAPTEERAAWTGPVAAITRARLSTRRLVAFHRAIPAVAASLRASPGCRAAIGIGEAPIMWQGTLSIWDDAAAINRFAYQGAVHRRVIAETPRQHWYREELFARFAVLESCGSIDGVDLAQSAGGPATSGGSA